MTLEIQLPPDIEARYAAEAKAKGVPLEQHIIERLIESAPATQTPAIEASRPARPLNIPLLKGRLIGSLSRRDIYDDRG